MAFEGTREVFARTEQNMLNAVARALTRAKNGLNVYVSVRHIARNAEGEINTNLTRDFLGYFGDNAKEQCKAAGASIEFTEQAGKSVRSTADSAFFESSPLMKSFVSNMAKNANADYVSAVAKAKLRSTAVSNEQAVREAVHDLADKGLFVNTYTDKNGRTVNVPVDVGVRQALQNSGKQRRMAQTLEIAEQTGNDLVEVNRTGNCRASHAEWQGRIYSISGKSAKYKSFYKACHVGDPVIGIGGYNCGHEFRIYRASQGRKFQDPITDPTYTTEQVRELTSKQRYYERKLRALKREREMLKSAGLEHAEVSRKITGTQNALKSLIANNKTVLTRQADRERVSPSAIKKSVAGGKNSGGVNNAKSQAYADIVNQLKVRKVANNPVKRLKRKYTEKEIIDKLAGGDQTSGSCSSLALAYIGNKCGLDVLDFRGGASCDMFANTSTLEKIVNLDGVNARIERVKREVTDTMKIIKNLDIDKEYYIASGKHAAIVRNNGGRLEYLELQSHIDTENGWTALNRNTLYKRFKCSKSQRTVYGHKLLSRVFIMEADSFANNAEFRDILGYINTAKASQQKGSHGRIK